MKVLFTNEDFKDFVAQDFADNTENMRVVDEDGESIDVDIADYLNVEFYDWSNRLTAAGDEPITSSVDGGIYEQWLTSINASLNKAYALVEITNDEVTASPDLDNGTVAGQITFIIQSSKIKLLDYYIRLLRRNAMGVPKELTTSDDEKITTMWHYGILSYDEEPQMLQFGECIVARCGFTVSYINAANTYNDMQIEMSFFNENSYAPLRLSKMSWQLLGAASGVTPQNRPDLSGAIITSLQAVKTLTFFDFKDSDVVKQVRNILLTACAYKIDGQLSSQTEVNKKVFFKVTTDGHEYIYRDVLERVEMSLVNNDINVISIVLRNYAATR